MYILHSRRKKTRTILTLAAVLLVLACAGYIAKSMMHDETTIAAPPAAVVTKVTDKRPKPKTIDTPQYSFDLPGDWESYQPAGGPSAGSAAWRNTAKNKGVQSLVVYLDAPVQELAVNRVLPVEVINSNRLEPAGSISDNCTNFTSPTPDQTAKGKAHSKWQNVEFLCDIGNYVRQVAGIAVAGSTNSVSLTGKSTGRHSVFITYNDNDPRPDYDNLSQVVQTFVLK